MDPASQSTDDPLLPELLPILDRLRQLTVLWSRGRDVGEIGAQQRHQAILLGHARYVARIAAYRQLADGITDKAERLEREVDLATLVNNLMVTEELFKSYDPAWLEADALAQLTAWLQTLYAHPMEIDLQGVTSLESWRERLKQSRIYVTYSSGTSGRLSFVPRDALTWAALVSNWGTYPNRLWQPGPSGYAPFDCLVLGPRGRGMGIQSAGTGLSQLASRSHFLMEDELGVDSVRRSASGPPQQLGGGEAAYERAFTFMLETTELDRPLLVFGPPFLVRALCEYAAAQSRRLRLRPESLLVSGGGWKSFDGERIPPLRLTELVTEHLGIPASHVVDTYSTAELNCVLMSCAERRYHVPPLVEPIILDESLTGAPGQQGEGLLGFLDPFALSYPGFFVTGDVARLVCGPCGCGLSGWAVEGEIRRAPSRPLRGCGGTLARIQV